MGLYNLDKIFEPGSVAVIGASEKKGSIGRAVVWNLTRAGFQGDLVMVNPNYSSVAGFPAYASIRDAGRGVDLAVIATPISTVPSIVRECVETGVKGAVIISAGGRETGPEGLKLEERIWEEAAAGGLRIIGPNCLGIIRPAARLNASFAAHTPQPGRLAFVSQSGAICASMLDLSIKEKMGYSHFVSIGSMLDVDFGDLVDYLSGDPEVQSILLYIESLRNFRKFMSAVRAASRIKPVVVIKSGRTEVGARAASSHTGAMAGEDSVYDAAFKRAGAVRVKTLEDFFDCAEMLAKQPHPRGKRITILTNSGGPGVMAADAVAEYELEAAPLTEETRKRLDEILPPHWSRGNPIDILGDAGPERYVKAVDCCLMAKETDGMLVILNPQAMFNAADTAKALIESLQKKSYPVFTAVMGGSGVEKGTDLLNQAGIPTYDTPERAIRSFMYLYRYSRNLEMLQEIPPLLPRNLGLDRSTARRLIEEGAEYGGLLTEVESKALLASYGLPVNRTEVARSGAEAVQRAVEMGFPVVMKIQSRDIVHKTEAGGVELDIRDEEGVRKAYSDIMNRARDYDPGADILGVSLQPMIMRPEIEILLGAKKDPNFGPVILFGLGGIYTEVLKDRNLALPPLNRLLARRLMEGTKAFEILKGHRGRPAAHLEQMEEIIIRLSQLLVDFPEIAELDINPLIIRDGQACAVDARVIVEHPDMSSPHHLVISPYPEQYEFPGIVRDGLKFLIRPIRPEDAPLLVDLFNTLSRTSIYYRFFSPLKSLPHSMLARFTQIDYDREMALVAVDEGPEGDRALGVARVIGHPDGKEGEFAVVVGDPWQGRGVGAELLRRCLRIVKERGMEHVWGPVLRENRQMIKLARKLGFTVSVTRENEYKLTIDLTAVEL